MHRPLLTAILLLLATVAGGQQTADWEDIYDRYYGLDAGSDEEALEREELMERLRLIADHPIDLNTATREDLEQLPFLSDRQIECLVEYRNRYQPVRSLNELLMVGGLDSQQQQLLPFFLYVDAGAQPARSSMPVGDLLRHGEHSLEAAARLPFYDRRGDINGYMGYKYRHRVRYEMTTGQRLRIGLLAAQDAGEPFFAANNRQGYDLYSFYGQLQHTGRLEQLVVGRYRAAMGMGLIAGRSFTLGKTMTLQSMGRQSQTLSVHSSRSEAGYFRGAGATIRLLRRLSLTAFASYRSIDATLDKATGNATTLVTSGYHRTPTEMAKKANTHLTSAGGSLRFRNNGITLSANAIYTQTDRPLDPDRTVLYRRHAAHGSRFANMSLGYGIRRAHFTVNGETAVDGDGALATVNSIGLTPSATLSLLLLQRFYSYRYTTLHGHSFSDGGRVGNESGIYVGLRWQPLRRWHLTAYADYAYSPWARYLISQSSHSWDLFAQLDYQRRRLTLSARWRSRLRQRDNQAKTALVDNNTHTLRLSSTYTPVKTISLKTQVDLRRAFYLDASEGWMASQQVAFRKARWQAAVVGAYFRTDDYDSRIYLFEQQLPGEFLSDSFYGHGYRLSLTAQAQPTRRLCLGARLGHTRYFNRAVIGSGLQQIDASQKTDLDIYAKWSF